MSKLACQYALLRFRPFVETGEFANVGVVRKALPASVLFPLAAPSAGGPAYAAFEEIREDLLRADVEVVAANDEPSIQAFAAAGA